MRTGTKRASAIGTAVGLVLIAGGVTPAMAAPQPTAFTASSCSSFQGATTTTGSQAAFTGVALRSGDTITTRVSPSVASDTIFLSTSINLNIILGEGPASGYTFTAPADGYYNLTFSFRAASAPATTLTWSFNATCSTTSVAPSPSPSPSATTKPGKGGGKKP